jgi:hypothetical protein
MSGSSMVGMLLMAGTLLMLSAPSTLVLAAKPWRSGWSCH